MLVDLRISVDFLECLFREGFPDFLFLQAPRVVLIWLPLGTIEICLLSHEIRNASTTIRGLCTSCFKASAEPESLLVLIAAQTKQVYYLKNIKKKPYIDYRD